MSITSRITSMEEHVTNAYNGLQGLGADLTGIDKNIDNIASVLDDIYDDLPKVTGSGTSITLDDTRKGRLESTLNGNTSQETTTGINKIKLVDKSSTTTGGVTYSVNNQVLTLSGTFTGMSILINFNDITLPAGTYYFYLLRTKTTRVDISLRSTNNVEIPGATFGNYFQNTLSNRAFTLSTDTLIHSMNLWFPSGTDTTDTYKVMICSASHTAEEYEPYTNGASPNPSYPQPVNVVSGDNEINVVGKNLYNDRISDYTRPADYRICPIKLEQGQQYVLKATLKGTTISGVVVAVVPYGDKYSDFSTKLNMAINNAGATNSILITPDDTWTSPKLVIYASNEETFNNIFKNYEIQLEKGATATTYEPYKRTDYDVDLGVVNLFDKDNANIINTYLIADGDGTLPSDGGERNNCAYIPCKSNTTYTIQKMEGKRFKVGYTYSTPTIGGNVYGKTGANNDTQITITTNSQAQYLIVYLRNGNVSGEITLQQALDSLQIEEGNKASSYSPYGTTPIELCKIGNYQDYFYKDSDKWYLHKEIGKVVLDGSEDWNADGGTQGTDYRHNILRSRLDIPNPIGINNTYLSNYFIAHTINNDVGVLGEFYCNANWFIFLDKNKVYDLNGWKTWLSTNNPMVYYVLATPTVTEITYQPLIDQLNLLEKAMSKDGQTNISQVNNDLPFIISASALKEWQESASLNSTLSMVNPLSLGNTLNTQENDIQPIEVDNIEPLEEEENEES